MSDLLLALRARIAEQQKPAAKPKAPGAPKLKSRPADYHRIWVPLARVTRVSTQHCRCCGEQVKFIAGYYVYLRSGAIHRIALESSLEASLQVAALSMPLSIEELDPEVVAECPKCLGIGDQAIEELISRLQQGSKQIDLWGGQDD